MPPVTLQEPTTKNNLAVDCISREQEVPEDVVERSKIDKAIKVEREAKE